MAGRDQFLQQRRGPVSRVFEVGLDRVDDREHRVEPDAIRQAALEVDIPAGGTIQGYGVKFFPPGTPMSGQNERSTPVVMQYVGATTKVVWPSPIRTADPVLPLPRHLPTR